MLAALRALFSSPEQQAEHLAADAFDAALATPGKVIDHGHLVGSFVIEPPTSPWVRRALANDLPATDLTSASAPVV